MRPGPLTTGPDPDRILTTTTGDITVTTPGTRITGLEIRGRIIIRAADVTIEQCRIVGGAVAPSTFAPLVDARGPNVIGLRVVDTEIAPQTAHFRWSAGIEGHDFALVRCNVHSAVDGANIYNTHAPGAPVNYAIDHTWIHDLGYFTAPVAGIVHPSDTNTHNDCVQQQGGSLGLITNSRLDATRRRNWGDYTDTGVPPVPQDVHAILLGHNVGRTSNLTVTDCELNEGWIPFNAGGAAKLDTGHKLGIFCRNTFRDPGAPTYAYNFDTTWAADPDGTDCFEGTPNASRWADTGLEVRVRRNG